MGNTYGSHCSFSLFLFLRDKKLKDSRTWTKSKSPQSRMRAKAWMSSGWHPMMDAKVDDVRLQGAVKLSMAELAINKAKT